MKRLTIEAKLTLTSLTLLALFMLNSVVAKAEDLVTPETLEYLVALFPVLLEAVKNGHWLVIGGAVVSGLTWGIKNFAMDKIKVPTYVLPGVVVLLSLILATATEAMETGDQAAAIAVFLGGLGSIPLYDMIRGWLREKGIIK